MSRPTSLEKLNVRNTSVFLLENGGVSLAETIDGLLDIAYHETVPAIGEKRGDQFLHIIGVLVFINHDLFIFFLQLPCRR